MTPPARGEFLVCIFMYNRDLPLEGRSLFLFVRMLRIALQAKGRLCEQSLELLEEIGISAEDAGRKYLAKSVNSPVEFLFLRDDDIPQAVYTGAADAGIVGYNEICEKCPELVVAARLGFGKCRMVLAVPNQENYVSKEYFNGKRIATSYPGILSRYLEENGLDASIRTIAGSVEIAPSVGMADAVFDIVSSGGTLLRNGLKEVETVLESEAVLVVGSDLPQEKMEIIRQMQFRIRAVNDSKGMKYVLMNIPDEKIPEIVAVLPAMKSPTVLPLAQPGWSSLHTVISEKELWQEIELLKSLGAEGILVLDLEKMIK